MSFVYKFQTCHDDSNEFLKFSNKNTTKKNNKIEILRDFETDYNYYFIFMRLMIAKKFFIFDSLTSSDLCTKNVCQFERKSHLLYICSSSRQRLLIII